MFKLLLANTVVKQNIELVQLPVNTIKNNCLSLTRWVLLGGDLSRGASGDGPVHIQGFGSRLLPAEPGGTRQATTANLFRLRRVFEQISNGFCPARYVVRR